MKLTDADDILISGAGIGGLTAALALAKIGLGVTIVERSPQLEEAGAGIQLSPNAARVLVELGLGPQLDIIATAPASLSIGPLSSARTLATLPLQALAARHGAPYLVLRRADLQTVLLEAVRKSPDIRLLTGRTIERFTASNDGVVANCRTLTDQITEHQASALIGADGLWSAIRPSVGNAASPFFTGYEAWRALLPADQTPGGIAVDTAEVSLRLGRDCHVVLYPVNHGQFLNIVAVQQARNARELRTRHDWSHAGLPAELGGLIAQAEPALADILKAVGSWQVWSLYDMPVANMAQGNVALLGDAAHPILPFMAQGAAIAIEDADTLSRCLAQVHGDRTRFGEALARYAKLRQRRARKVRKASRKNAKAYHTGFPWTLARDQVIRLLGAGGMMRRYRWLYGWKKDL
ncbi:MAG: FAD-dependent monooxygenase [Beijerinckiaceae bacterium]|nr:FAD-dependent monooxygenase [Beijerinckiaceae bacterium]